MERFSKQLQFLLTSVFLHLLFAFFLFPNSILSSENSLAKYPQQSLESFEVVSSLDQTLKSENNRPKQQNQINVAANEKPGVGLGHVTAPQLRRSFPISYPEQARQRGQEGQVEALLTLSADGSVQQVEIISASDQEFILPAREGLQRYQFLPATENGTPVSVKIKYVYHFRFKEN